MSYWIAISLGGIATYLTRLAPLIVKPRGTAPAALRRYLDALPIAVIAALAGAGVAVPDTTTNGAEVVGAIVAIALARWRRNLLVAVVGGVIVVAGLRALGL